MTEQDKTKQPVDDRPVTFAQVKIYAGLIAEFFEYVRWLATNPGGMGAMANVRQLWAFYVGFVRDGRPAHEVAAEVGLPASPDW